MGRQRVCTIKCWSEINVKLYIRQNIISLLILQYDACSFARSLAHIHDNADVGDVTGLAIPEQATAESVTF